MCSCPSLPPFSTSTFLLSPLRFTPFFSLLLVTSEAITIGTCVAIPSQMCGAPVAQAVQMPVENLSEHSWEEHLSRARFTPAMGQKFGCGCEQPSHLHAMQPSPVWFRTAVPAKRLQRLHEPLVCGPHIVRKCFCFVSVYILKMLLDSIYICAAAI